MPYASLVRPEDWVPQGIGGLEDRAWDALRETERSVCVTAGAGAGKTELLAQKAAYLLQTGICAAPKRILAISFKRDAAATLSDRVRMRTSEEQARRFVSLTFDAWTKGLVDQFGRSLPTGYAPPADYEIGLATRDVLNAFLVRVGSDMNPQQLGDLVARTPLPVEGHGLPRRVEETLVAYWRQQYEGFGRPLLTFAMINRLAECLLRTHEGIRAAQRATYRFVFLDEFQDTTEAQFQLVRAAFDPQRAVLTTVGDDKQRIMGWAGAMPDGFARFSEAYSARQVSLLCNWRSHEDLVVIQRIVASRIDPDVEPMRARRSRSVDGAVSAIWAFDDRRTEVRTLADWIADEIRQGRVAAHDVAILVRNLPDGVAEELGPVFAARGIVLNNLARDLGGITVQDVLSEELTALLLPFLRLGSCRRDPDAWSRALQATMTLAAVQDGDDAAAERVVQRTEALARSLRRFMAQHPPAPSLGQEVLAMQVEALGEAAIRQSNPSYRREPDFARALGGITTLLEESVREAATWQAALDRFEGKGQVPLMTIHKSKGMEFHTVVFFGLDSQSWWSLTPTRAEELKSFFVALTRAQERAFFTCCGARGGRIRWLEAMLGSAVPRVEGGPR